MSLTTNEPILTGDNTRFCLFPIKHPDIWFQYQRQKNSFWVAEEIDYKADLKDWVTLDKNEQYFIEHVLAFFAGADGIVLENLGVNFIEEVKIPEARFAYVFQATMENTHSTVYSLLIDTYITDPDRKMELFKGVETIKCVKDKATWAFKWMTRDKPFAYRLVAFAVLEGVFFSGSFCAIFWLKDRKKMVTGLGSSNELISRDEGMHTDFAILLYSKLNNKLHQNEIYDIFREAVAIETEFITESLPCSLIGMNSGKMEEYIKFVADRLLVQLGYEKLYNSKNPFYFMESISLDGKSNFFEKKPTEYRLGTLTTATENFSLDTDF